MGRTTSTGKIDNIEKQQGLVREEKRAGWVPHYKVVNFFKKYSIGS